MDNDPLEVRIDIKPSVNRLIPWIFVFQGIKTLLGAILSAMGLIFLSMNSDDITLMSLINMSCYIVMFLVGIKYLDRVFYKEYLLLKPDEIIVVYKSMFSIKNKHLLVDQVRFFGLADPIQFTNHPFGNSVVDFTGLAAMEREVQFIINEGNMELIYENGSVRFGKDVPSWDAEELIEKIETHYNRKFNHVKQ